MFVLLKRLSEGRVMASCCKCLYMFTTKPLSAFCLSWCHYVLQARSYIQSLAYKPTVPWTRIFPTADPNGERRHIDVIMLFSFLEDSLPCTLFFGCPSYYVQWNLDIIRGLAKFVHCKEVLLCQGPFSYILLSQGQRK